MYINITDSVSANNRGSSRELVSYLEKENTIGILDAAEYWFNCGSQAIEAYQVRNAIDNNVGRLGRADAKFFLINISPSQKELKYLSKAFGEEDMKERLKLFAEKVMDRYAANFKRDGISSSNDLVWFGKIEHNRYYSFRDREVTNGEKKRGEIKAGRQLHIQVIVSRKDASNKIKLSPMNTSRGKNEGHSKKLGQFDRVAFKNSGEALFDSLFGFDRKLDETFAYANILKNGSAEQLEQLSVLEMQPVSGSGKRNVGNELAREITAGLFSSTAEILKVAQERFSALAGIMMEPVYNPVQGSYPINIARKKKRKKHLQQDQGIGR